MRNWITLVIFVLFVGGCTKCSKEFKSLTQEEIDAIVENVQALPNVPVDQNEVAVIETNKGTIEFKFFPEVAPNHCANFKKLANAGFYNGTTFHRVIPNFVIQGGDILSRDDNPFNDGTGDAGYKVAAEFSDLHHDRGVVSTARESGNIHSAGTQFFICVKPIPHLDGQYTIFGKVTKGLDVVDKIVNVPRGQNDRPLENVVMQSVKVMAK